MLQIIYLAAVLTTLGKLPDGEYSYSQVSWVNGNVSQKPAITRVVVNVSDQGKKLITILSDERSLRRLESVRGQTKAFEADEKGNFQELNIPPGFGSLVADLITSTSKATKGRERVFDVDCELVEVAFGIGDQNMLVRAAIPVEPRLKTLFTWMRMEGFVVDSAGKEKQTMMQVVVVDLATRRKLGINGPRDGSPRKT